MTDKRVLIVEDEPKLAQLLADYFIQDGYQTHILMNGSLVSPWLAENAVDVMLLDLMLPGKDGLSICKETRLTSDLPILMVTARVDEIDRLLGLDLGADDYICKPFSPREVVARVNGILRRIRGEFKFQKHWRLNEERYEFEFDQAAVALTAAEFHLLKRLCQNPGQIYSRNHLMNTMYDDNRVVSERTIDSHVKRLRKKLSAIAPEFIESVYGVGYRITC